jgi:homoserine O-acetyltransferase
MSDQPENPFAHLVADQSIIHIPSFTLESGEMLHDVPVAYKTWGRLLPAGNNCLVLCHTLTSSADVEAWWPSLFGQDSSSAFDTSRFFIICMNCLGSPYGSASPCTRDPSTGRAQLYGSLFPLTTIRDDVQ